MRQPYLDVKAGVIDEDYRGEIKVILHNLHTNPVQINKRMRIAQLLLEKIVHPDIELTKSLHQTDRGTDGFGSTGLTTEKPNTTDKPNIDSANPQACHIHNLNVETPQNITMDSDGDGPYLEIELRVKGDNETLGLNVHTNTAGHIILKDCIPSTPAAKIPKWRSTLRNARVKQIYGQDVITREYIITAIRQAKECSEMFIKCKFATEKSVDIHPQKGIPQIHFDQLYVIAKHHYEARTGERFYQVVEEGIPAHHSVQHETNVTRVDVHYSQYVTTWDYFILVNN